MSALTFNSASGKSIVNQGFLSNQQTNPSGTLTRRGRLARTCVVLSLTVVMAAGFASQSGAGQDVASTAPSYEIIVVAPGETLWSVAAAYASGDVQVWSVRFARQITSQALIYRLDRGCAFL